MTAPKPTPQAVSAFLGQAFERTQRCGPTSTGGFVVRDGLSRLGGVRYVAVEYDPGTRRSRSGTPEGLLKLAQAELAEYEKHLAQRYKVSRNDDDGPDEWNCLLVWMKGEGE